MACIVFSSSRNCPTSLKLLSDSICSATIAELDLKFCFVFFIVSEFFFQYEAFDSIRFLEISSRLEPQIGC